MPRTLLTPVTPKGPYPGTVNANDLDAVFTSADQANGNYFVGTGRELIEIQNADAGAQTFTITSKADPYGRTGNVSAYSMAAGEHAIFWLGNLVGWDQGGGQIYLDASSNNISFRIIRIPG
jgi:hypothetical protein